ncbi:hypothetical protein IGI04_003523 [Brassica rapa subsp. trilocularis]|uniref:Photosystem I reaction center subunit VI n=1 Tax=Brassica rapa subsp. trilocularis TaxID=1813537 RepID=A0ABQ7P0P6_BRACM|nr:hypothetical protein IGI04_003523 [Brassica rapa subsp. trilocularis]
MASLATVAAVKPSAAVNGLGGSSLAGAKLSFKPSSLSIKPKSSKFFETFAAPFTKRGLLLKFLILGGGSLLTYVSASSTGDVLPIKRGPQEKPKLGPRGKL